MTSRGHRPEVYVSADTAFDATAYQIKPNTLANPTTEHAPNELTVTWASAKKEFDIDLIPDCTL